jgi:tripartite ATP-independent transporter DctM subunit
MYAAYFMLRAWLQPHLAPPYQGEKLPLGIRLRRLVTLVPLALLILLVTGFIFLGIATPSESAALGAVGAFVVSWAHGRMDWRILRESLLGTLSTTAMIMLILVGATTFSQLLSMTGAAPALVDAVTTWQLGPIGTTLLIQVTILILGCFIDAISIMLITVPVFMPVAAALGIDPIWLCVLMLIQLELGGITPPFGVLLFVMKGVRPNLSTLTIYDAVWPIVLLQLLLCFLVMFTPALTGWLPALMIR